MPFDNDSRFTEKVEYPTSSSLVALSSAHRDVVWVPFSNWLIFLKWKHTVEKSVDLDDVVENAPCAIEIGISKSCNYFSLASVQSLILRCRQLDMYLRKYCTRNLREKSFLGEKQSYNTWDLVSVRDILAFSALNSHDQIRYFFCIPQSWTYTMAGSSCKETAP